MVGKKDEKARAVRGWETLSSKMTFEDRWIRMRSDRVRLPNGTILDTYHVVEAPSNINVIAMTAGKEVILVEQWRHPVARLTLEFPAGIIEEGEQPQAAARRELLEETGFASEEWHLLGSSDEYPSRQNNQVSSFLALNCRKVAEPQPDPGELIAVTLLPWPEFRRQLGNGERSMGAMHYAALVWLDDFLRKNPGVA